MLDYDSEDIDGMDDDAGDDQEPAPTGHWKTTSSYDIYTWWTSQRMGMAMEQRRMTPPRNNLSAGVSGAAQNPAKTNTVIPAQEIIILWKVLKETPSNKI